MADTYLTCPFCGFEFARVDTLCEHGCPLGSWCHMIRCPNCQYEYVEPRPRLTWLQRLLGRRAPEQGQMERVVPVDQLQPGEHVTVMCVGGSDRRQSTLAVFGLAPGAEVTLIQRHPEYVLRVGETELALEGDIAGTILVERSGVLAER